MAWGANGKLLGVMACTVVDGRIVEILSVSDPERLASMGLPATSRPGLVVGAVNPQEVVHEGGMAAAPGVDGGLLVRARQANRWAEVDHWYPRPAPPVTAPAPAMTGARGHLDRENATSTLPAEAATFTWSSAIAHGRAGVSSG